MRNKQIKVIYFSFGGSDVREISLDWKKIIAIFSTVFTLLLFLASVVVGLTTDFFHNRQVTHLSKANKQLNGLLDDMTRRVSVLETQVQDLEKEDNDLRIFVDLPQIDSDVRKLGIGGHSLAAYGNGNTESIPEDTRSEAMRVKNLLDNLEQRIQIAADSRSEILNKYSEDLKKIKHTPSIRPVINGRYTDRFGFRLDPLVDKVRPHHGLDIAAPRGTPIYAAADGVVNLVVEKYRPNYGYGKLVEIDHGYGFKTRYAHLNKILVKKGQKITRHTIIGHVGDTGRSTGPHLHYEVLAQNKPVNPELYILD
ncbi:M23 family metallopeptidase [candidate division KSB1 bacterium]|nr:M23 family metallopeptidase [candidate division KSB1 bacterium]